MKLAHLGAISTGTVIVLGIALIAPAFIRISSDANRGISVLLSFDVLGGNSEAASDWCSGLASILDKHGTKAVVFMAGRTAEESPECATSFSHDVDLGSRTYSYVDLTAVDYRVALDEVWTGKVAVGEAGVTSSKLFKAPYGSADENIYSLLRRSEILADFSYADHYNKFENDQFVRYNLTSFAGDQGGQEQFFVLISSQPSVTAPIVVNFDDSMQLQDIDGFITRLEGMQDDKVHVVSASDLLGVDLTVREGDLR